MSCVMLNVYCCLPILCDVFIGLHSLALVVDASSTALITAVRRWNNVHVKYEVKKERKKGKE